MANEVGADARAAARETLAKARKLLEALIEPHDEPNNDDHKWCMCRRCLAREELEYDSSVPMWQAILSALDERVTALRHVEQIREYLEWLQKRRALAEQASDDHELADVDTAEYIGAADAFQEAWVRLKALLTAPPPTQPNHKGDDMIPTIGRLVHYRLSADDAAQINRRRTTGASIAERLKWGPTGKHNETVPAHSTEGSLRAWPAGAQAHIGNEAKEGDAVPMIIVKTWGDTAESSVNGQAFLDGNDVLWVTSVAVGEGPRTFSWPTRS